MRFALYTFATVLAGIFAVTAPAQVPFVVHDLGNSTMPLNGAWQFHTGDDPAWASATLDDSAWQPIETGRPWEGQGHRDYTGFAWYRRHIVFTPNGSPRDNPGLNLALLLPGAEDAAEVFWNGRLVGSYGQVPPHPAWYATGFPQVFPLGPAQSGVLAIRVWAAPVVFLNSPDQGGLYRTPAIGTVEGIVALQTKSRYGWLRRSLFTFAVALVSAMVGLLSMLFWLRDRSRWLLFWLSIPMLKPLVVSIIFGIPGFSTFRLGYGSVGEIVAISYTAIWFLLLYLLDLRAHVRLLRWTKFLALLAIGLTLIDTIMVWLDWTRLFPDQFVYFDIASTIPVELLELYVLVIVSLALRKRLDLARWLLAISTVLAALEQAVADLSGLGGRWTHWTTLSQSIYYPLFTLAGSPVTVSVLIDLFLLASILYAAWRYSVEESQRQIALQEEFRNAQELQQVLVPETLPAVPGYEITSAYRPAQQVGGDFFQLIALPHGGALLVIGDVSGKGLKAAMTVSLLVGAIRSTVETTHDPAEILAALNRRLHGRLSSGFATSIALRVDADGSCELANAGHLPPFLNGEEITLPPALPLGLVLEAEYEKTALQMAVGDRLTLYTDGLLEARNFDGELFGFARLAQLAATAPHAQTAAEAAVAFGQDDDITVLTLQRLVPA